MLDKSNPRHRVYALHRYFCWTTLLKRDFEAALLRGDYLPKDGESPLMFPVRYMTSDVGMYMSYWYGALYVVCEGWGDLGLSDPKVDRILQHPNIDLLKRYRNGAFHFQKDYFDARFTDLYAEKSSVEWVRSLSETLGEWFLEFYKKNPEEQK